LSSLGSGRTVAVVGGLSLVVGLVEVAVAAPLPAAAWGRELERLRVEGAPEPAGLRLSPVAR
jgi:hypothetical protein